MVHVNASIIHGRLRTNNANGQFRSSGYLTRALDFLGTAVEASSVVANNETTRNGLPHILLPSPALI